MGGSGGGGGGDDAGGGKGGSGTPGGTPGAGGGKGGGGSGKGEDSDGGSLGGCCSGGGRVGSDCKGGVLTSASFVSYQTPALSWVQPLHAFLCGHTPFECSDHCIWSSPAKLPKATSSNVSSSNMPSDIDLSNWSASASTRACTSAASASTRACTPSASTCA